MAAQELDLIADRLLERLADVEVAERVPVTSARDAFEASSAVPVAGARASPSQAQTSTGQVMRAACRPGRYRPIRTGSPPGPPQRGFGPRSVIETGRGGRVSSW
jgi:hypothetical protein